MVSSADKSFFSVALELIVVERPIPYDLYVNSSTHPEREHFVKIFPNGDILDQKTLRVFKEKYFQFYVKEEERSLYLRGIAGPENLSEIKKTEIIKNVAINYLNKLFDGKKEFNTEILSESVQGCRDSVESMVDVIQNYSIENLHQMIGQLSFHDFYTYDHSVNVSMYCIIIYKHLFPQAPRDEIVLAGLGGLLHDLGKLEVPTHIINKPDKLTAEEFEEIKKHPGHGHQLLVKANCCTPGINFSTLDRIIHEHHENFNGTGYPQKLKSHEIHLMARITAIADFFDAITTHRAYHQALPLSEAIEVMRKTEGRKIDPQLFSLFTEVAGRIPRPKNFPLELPDEFDPCQPQKVLPFVKSAHSVPPPPLAIKSQKLESEGGEKEFGKVMAKEKEWLKKLGKKMERGEKK